MNTSKKPKVSQVKPNVGWGLYMWKLPNGKLFQDGDGNYLSIPSRRNDLEKMAIIKSAAAYNGKLEGEAHFEPGVEQRTEEEYQEQKSKMEAGEINDKDYGAIMDEIRAVGVEG